MLFSKSHFLLDNLASVNVFCNPNLLTDIRKSKRGILLNGVQLEVDAVRVDMEGDFGEVGPVYFSQGATANILSFAAMVDRGADIRYDHAAGRFSLQPAGSLNIYSFCRQPVPGWCERRSFYVCDVRSMVRATPRNHSIQRALMTTVSDNMGLYTKREIASTGRARELLARMGYPPVEMAIAMIRGGNNFDVSENDFRIAHSIWGKCLASMRGRTHKKSSPVADISMTPALVQMEQVLAVDIVLIDTTAILVAVSTPLDLACSLMRLDFGKPSRAAAGVKAALDEMLCVLKSRNFAVQVIMSDGESAIVWSYRVYRAYGPYRTSSRSTRSFRLLYTYIPTTTT